MLRRRLALCVSVSAGSYLLLSAPHYARRSEEKEAQKIQRPRLPPKQFPTERPESTLYSPIIEEKSQIRVLSIQGGSQSDDLRCDLDVVSLDDNPKYCALSYTWGEPIKRSQPLWTLPGLYHFLRELYRRLFKCPRMIFVNDQRFKVTDNLYSALAQLRHEEHALPLWIDQICINQDDPDEKSSQVGLMTTIYDKAQRTYIWLGPSADDSDAAMDFIRSVKPLTMRDLDDVSVPWSGLQALFARSWWERIWVVQEMLLSRRATVKCGTKEVDLAAFVPLAALDDDAVSTRHFNRTIDSRKRRALMPPGHPFHGLLRLWDRRNDVESGHRTFWLYDMFLSALLRLDGSSFEKSWRMPKMNLWQWVYHTQQFQSTMQRDRIFALLGLARQEDRASVKVSYPEKGSDRVTIEKGDCKIFTEAAAWMIRNEKSLDVLQLSRPESKALTLLPSWVPDFSTASRGAIDTLLWSYHADGGPEAWSKLTPENVVEEKYYEYTPTQSLDWAERRLLWVLPFQLILLRWPRAPGRWMSVAVPIHGGWLGNSLLHSYTEFGKKSRLAYRADPVVSEDGNRISLQGLVVDRIDVVDPAPNLGVAHETQSLQALERQRKQLTRLLARWESLALAYAANPYGDKPGGKHEAFWRVVATNGLRAQDLMYPWATRTEELQWGKLYEKFTGPLSLAALSQRLSKEEMEKVDQYGTAALRATASRALLITKGGFIGLGPQPAKQGDLLCLLRGGKVPFILRARDDGTYRYVGDSYVQGLMVGEYFARDEARREDVQTFDLR